MTPSVTTPGFTAPALPARLLGARLLVRLDVGAQVTPAGIVLPPSAQELQPYGDVIVAGDAATGPDAPRVGDRVLVDVTKGTTILETHGARYVIYTLDDIQAIIEP